MAGSILRTLTAILLLALGGLAVLLVWSLESGEPPAPAQTGPLARRPRTATAPAPAPVREAASRPAPAAGATDFARNERLRALAAALAGGRPAAARDAAARLRRLLRERPELRAAAFACLGRKDLPLELREALVLVLGTLPGKDIDEGLLHALGPPPVEPALRPWLLLALGAAREPPEKDDVFDMGDQPYGIEGPGGLGITIQRAIADRRVRDALAAALLGGDSREVRLAAVRALRHSLAAPDARDAFRTALGKEQADTVAAPLAEALARAARSLAGDEGARLLAEVLARAGRRSFTQLRFQIEDELRAGPLPAAARTRLLGLAAHGTSADVRRFALTLLAEAPNPDTRAQARRLAARVLAGDPEPALRDRAAYLLRKLAPGAETLRLLERAARSDPAWRVRWSALDTLLALESPKTLKALLEALARDPAPRVAARARAALARAQR